jgi:hypothetical protein
MHPFTEEKYSMTTRTTKFLAAFISVGSIFFACNRHTTATVTDPMTGPVPGDTVAFYPTMTPQLIKDSAEKDPAYYYRINRVRRVEIVDGNSLEYEEIDRFGHQLLEKHYIDGALFWKNVDVYNRYGHLASSRHSFYNNGSEADLEFVSKYRYEPESSTGGERIVSLEMECMDWDGDMDKMYVYNYSYSGKFLNTETRFENDKCTEKVYYTYTDFGKPKEEMTIEFKDEGPDTTYRIYKYDSLQRETNWTIMHKGVLESDHVTEYNNDGRESKYTSVTYEPYSSYVFEYFYLPNGLINYRMVTHDGKSEKETYRYAYY